jgi:hypothetical protein
MRTLLAVAVLTLLGSDTRCAAAEKELPKLVRSAKSGPWSKAETWEGGKVPAAGARVQIRSGHAVVYDVSSKEVIRSIHVAGALRFDPKKDTRLEVGLILVQPGDKASESGFDCDAHVMKTDGPKPVLEVGTPDSPVAADRSALIRLHYVSGLDKESCPAIVCCGGRMDFHGAAMSRSWVKLGEVAKAGSTEVELSEAVDGWRVGDVILLTATLRQNKQKKTFKPSTRDSSQSEERRIKALDGKKVTLDKALTYDHAASGNYRGEVANLSRNVVVESADPKGERGHTMYHRYSAGSISYAEFRHLGKEGVLGRYSLHFHLCGDTMRGSSVIGASIHDSGNRWLTIHGTNYLVVRDCVGYKSIGHGFFMEDGTEVYNVLDRNLAVQAFIGKPLPKQVLPFDKNDGSGFWWGNCHNTFTRNVACDCDEYGYFFQMTKTADFDPVLQVQRPDGEKKTVDVRKLPFVRFEDNETHCQRRHGFNLGGGVPFGKPNVDGVGPDEKHPLVIRNLRAWNVHWAIHPVSPCVLLDNLEVHNAEYGVWRPVYDRHVYRSLKFDQVPDNLRYAFVSGPPSKAELKPVDDLPPITVITHVRRTKEALVVRGTTSDDGTVTKVKVNGHEAKSLRNNFAEWEATIPDARRAIRTVKAEAQDEAGNKEKRPHEVSAPE